MNWQQIQESFRGSFEGALWSFVALVVLGIALPLGWHCGAERLAKRRKLGRIRRRLHAQGIGPEEWRLLESAIQSTCPENPDRLFGSLSLFHTWIDGLPEVESAPPELMASLARIKELAFPDSGHIFVPHSTRDLLPGASLNLVAHRGGQEVIPCIVTEVSMEGLRLARRAGGVSAGLPGDQVSLFYPRPEAMYHAVVRLLEGAGEIRTGHALQGHFKVRQLREFWRVDVDMELAFTVLPEAVELLEGEAAPAPDSREGRLINLSGNGAAIVTRRPPYRGALITFSLPLPSRTMHNLQAEVLHISGGKEMQRLHLVFRNLDPGDQELIIRNLFVLYREIGGLTPEPDSVTVTTRTVTL
jgi:hypothetical protein